MNTHELKTWPIYWSEVNAGRKLFEIRRDDRPYACGDLLLLREWDPDTGDFTGNWCIVRVIYLMRDCVEMGLREGFVLMGIKPWAHQVEEGVHQCQVAAFMD